MSVSSGTTLVSPSVNISNHHAQNGMRRNSSHSSHPSHAHHAKRRGSAHVHHNNAGTSRRLSDGESGRRALTSGLAMHALDQPKIRRKSSNDGPLPKATRSDTHLPRLSRTTSVNSIGSDASHASVGKRPTKSRKRSGESVQILSESGNEAETAGSGEEGWEDGDGDVTPAKGKSKADGARLRRTASDAQAETSRPSGSDRLQEDIATATSPGALPAEFHHPHLQTMKTKGFSGSVQTPDPQLAMQTHLNDGMPHWNDPTHIMPAHQLRHQQSSRTLAALAKANDDEPGGARGEAKTNGPSAPQGTRSSAGSGLPITHESPSFPFPTVNVLYSASSPLASTDPTTLRDRISSADGISKPRRRLASGTEPPRIPHRRSISSLRSAHFSRAPPHPLNSSTGYRSEMLPTVGTSRPGSAFTAPEKKDRVPSMHHPPLAPPIVYRENASGQGWDDPERQESSGRVQINSHDMGQRKSSSSSARSLNGILTGPIYNRPQVSPAASSASSHASNAPRPRRSALEAAASMSKLPTTHDPALYYQSLGLPSTSAETAHLISRFLPQKKIVRPSWEISPAEAREGHVGIGLTNGDYREAHESLVRSMRDLSLGTTASRRSASKSYSYRNLLGSGSSSATDVVAQGGVGMISGINGPKMVSRGAWRGRTPFELSVERCLAQRPKGPVSGLQA